MRSLLMHVEVRMPTVTTEAVREYLERLLGKPVRILSLGGHDKQELAGDLKAFGYGTPVFIEYESGGTSIARLSSRPCPPRPSGMTISPTAPRPSSGNIPPSTICRAMCVLSTAARFPSSGAIVSTGDAEEFFLLTEFVPGQGYFKDLDRIRRKRHRHRQ